MGNGNLAIVLRIILYWYIFIFLSTEILSFVRLVEVPIILLLELLYWGVTIFIYRKQLKELILRWEWQSKTVLFITFLSSILFIQGFFSAPSTTDSMVYHLPRIMYWLQDKTLYQDVIRNDHDFMAPFAEYVLLHLFSLTNSDRLLYLSQWIAYLGSIITAVVLARQLGASAILQKKAALLVAVVPIAVMQAVSTQVDMVTTVMVLITLYLALNIYQTRLDLVNSILIGSAVGLGILTKAPFVLYLIIPASVVLLSLYKNLIFKKLILLTLSALLVLLIQLRHLSQNYFLFGNFMGKHLINGQGNLILTNESLNPLLLVSNLIRNLMLNIPVPFFTVSTQKVLEQLHEVMRIPLNSVLNTLPGTSFQVSSIIYPQEDIVANPLHLLLILSAGILLLVSYLFSSKKTIIQKITNLPSITPKLPYLIYIMTILSLILFSAVLKWQPYHNRLIIPFFMVGTITSVIICHRYKIGEKLTNLILLLAIPLALIVVAFNISRPYFSYNLFYNVIKQYSLPNSTVPQSFLTKPGLEQYFNARSYWYQPYNRVTDSLSQYEGAESVSFTLMDNFEYPLWVLMREKNITLRVIPAAKSTDNTVSITTSILPVKKDGFRTECFGTIIDYGYACLSRKAEVN